MADERFNDNYTYDEQFEGNIMVVGRTGCGKTTFIQNLGKNRMFGKDINLVFWVSKIRLSGEREDVIRESFLEQTVKFVYPSNLDEFNYLIDFFMSEKMPESSAAVENTSALGENIRIDKLIVMDDVSGLADRCDDFSNFLTVSRKYGFSCIYVFHTIYPGRQSWEMIMSQTHIFNFFPGSVHSGRILKTLSLFASRERNTYVPTNQIWLNRLYFQISNSRDKICLTIDTRDVNHFGPGKFRTKADSGQEQHCYFNRSNTDSRFKCFLAKRVSAEQDRPVFSIVEQNYCLTIDEKTYKSTTDILQQSTTADKKIIETGQHTDRKNNSDDREPETVGRRNRSVDAAESTPPRERIQFERQRSRTGTKRQQQDNDRARKKPRFLSY